MGEDFICSAVVKIISLTSLAIKVIVRTEQFFGTIPNTLMLVSRKLTIFNMIRFVVEDVELLTKLLLHFCLRFVSLPFIRGKFVFIDSQDFSYFNVIWTGLIPNVTSDGIYWLLLRDVEKAKRVKYTIHARFAPKKLPKEFLGRLSFVLSAIETNKKKQKEKLNNVMPEPLRTEACGIENTFVSGQKEKENEN